ncbi:hypothetical protein BANE1_18 [Mycobacterium phage Bane1]|uniref:Uncharacterized protein n=3 Tax=Coopervirus TaxID=1982898 RepID=T2A9R3_9CAUD|nr:hypothetical protein BANE1_18 [Mycobacterium phage Bane1]YP_010089204.1 hypothetical protein KNT58_gp17 [Mycobacterium phage Fortunato]AGU92134.1 hypothetical protein BANE2_18 [Mycobacterium phage Bane2]WNM65035.1 hypothetical protein SEA_MUDSLIDE_17 [Mycobacterium phage Mudslide]AGU92036.1 hypothetical protein BANE1_18 [Mycobacterium phage Bane1]AOT27240.1 hypothetical protein SEA_FORTUNATO_17 [Mycobacterium phage Fortunato]
MTPVLELIYSFPFVTGLLVGIAAQRVYAHAMCRYENTRHPLPGGRKHHVAGINRMWLAGLVLLATLGYVLLQTGQTEAKYRGLARDVAHCQTEFNAALRARSNITAENDELSVKQRDLLTQLDEAAGVLVNRQLNPPSAIAALPMDDPRRLAWNEDVTRVYYERTQKLREQIGELRRQQNDLLEDRRRHPLPEPTCGVLPPAR